MHTATSVAEDQLAGIDIPIERDLFLRKLLRELAGTLQDVIGLEEASGFVSIVGQRIGEWMDDEYRRALGVDELSPGQVPAVLVDLKKRIQGDFAVESIDQDKIVLVNRACPFGDKVRDRPSLCMMTANVFGTVTSENLGYAKVALHETIARGDPGCRVVVYLRHTEQAEQDAGNEYYRS
jgi:predicted ArsR family transcriptional regulator